MNGPVLSSSAGVCFFQTTVFFCFFATSPTQRWFSSRCGLLTFVARFFVACVTGTTRKAQSIGFFTKLLLAFTFTKTNRTKHKGIHTTKNISTKHHTTSIKPRPRSDQIQKLIAEHIAVHTPGGDGSSGCNIY